jgi:hypothetical protein
MKNLKLLFLFQLTVGSIPLFAQKDAYKTTILTLCDALLPTQINESSDPNYGVLSCPSLNPENQSIHSRAAESVYPLAIA